MSANILNGCSVFVFTVSCLQSVRFFFINFCLKIIKRFELLCTGCMGSSALTGYNKTVHRPIDETREP